MAIRNRPAWRNPCAAITRTPYEVLAYHAGNAVAVFGADIAQREANAHAYLRRHVPLVKRVTQRLKRRLLP